MAKTSSKWKEPSLQLLELVPMGKRSKCGASDANDAYAELDSVLVPRTENRFRVQTERSKQIDEVGGCQIEVDMLETKQGHKEDAAVEHCGLLPCQDDGQDENAI